MNQLDLAIYDAVHDFPEGTQELADLMGMSRQILLNKANFNTENAYFSPQQLKLLQKTTKTHSINDALVAYQSKKIVGNNSITTSILNVVDSVGKAAHEVNKSVEDGIVTEREKADCLKLTNEIRKTVDELDRDLHTTDINSKIVNI
ncbi:MAG: hypothetical protein COB23_03075 [Methylophaga sp.]|nr:MAG: hypothetical protein COB23_03075 [Methylophaga sp.]